MTPQLQVEQRAWMCAVSDCEKSVIRKTAGWDGGWGSEYSKHNCKTVEEYAKKVRDIAEERILLYEAAKKEYDAAESHWKKTGQDHFTMMVWKEETDRCSRDLLNAVSCDDPHGGKNYQETFPAFARRLIHAQLEALKSLEKARAELKKVIDKIAYPHIDSRSGDGR